MERLKTILADNRTSHRPEYYSGRGATLTDLDGDILEGIFQGIEKEFGKKAAKAFVKMVDGIKVMSATTFLKELKSLFYADWKYKAKKEDESGIEIPKDKNGEYNPLMGMFGVMSALTNKQDDTQSIKVRFLIDHGIEPEVMYEDRDGRYRRYGVSIDGSYG